MRLSAQRGRQAAVRSLEPGQSQRCRIRYDIACNFPLGETRAHLYISEQSGTSKGPHRDWTSEILERVLG
jgi:hypothetical protein